jgi:RNA polymerase sigma-70 factor (ECF subfamily)
LIAQLRAGDEDAFERVVQQYGGRILATARRFLNNEHDAQDAVQEAFASALRALEKFKGDAMLSTWLHRIVVNAALAQLRSKRRRGERTIEELLPSFDQDGEWIDDPATWTNATEMILDRRDTREMVRRSIARLPENYRSVLMLRDIEELDTDEAARSLAIQREHGQSAAPSWSPGTQDSHRTGASRPTRTRLSVQFCTTSYFALSRS